MNTEVIERRWNRLLDAMTDAARTLAVPLTGMPVGVALGMIVRPETYSPLEMRVTAIVYLAIMGTLMTSFTVKYWRQPEGARHSQMIAAAQRTLENAQKLYTGALALTENAVAIHETTTEVLRAARDRPDAGDERP
jgi:hypothetical protein